MTSKNCSRRENKSQARNKMGIYRTTTDYMIRQCQKQKTIASKTIAIEQKCFRATNRDRAKTPSSKKTFEQSLCKNTFEQSRSSKNAFEQKHFRAIAIEQKHFRPIEIEQSLSSKNTFSSNRDQAKTLSSNRDRAIAFEQSRSSNRFRAKTLSSNRDRVIAIVSSNRDRFEQSRSSKNTFEQSLSSNRDRAKTLSAIAFEQSLKKCFTCLVIYIEHCRSW